MKFLFVFFVVCLVLVLGIPILMALLAFNRPNYVPSHPKQIPITNATHDVTVHQNSSVAYYKNAEGELRAVSESPQDSAKLKTEQPELIEGEAMGGAESVAGSSNKRIQGSMESGKMDKRKKDSGEQEKILISGENLEDVKDSGKRINPETHSEDVKDSGKRNKAPKNSEDVKAQKEEDGKILIDEQEEDSKNQKNSEDVKAKAPKETGSGEKKNSEDVKSGEIIEEEEEQIVVKKAKKPSAS